MLPSGLHAMSHRWAVAVMVLVTLLWSMAGVVTRQVEQAQGLELTFWRSAFNALALLAFLSWRAGGLRPLWLSLIRGGGLLWASGACWAVMFTAFMAALTMTTVANVLLTMALAPLFTALLARLVLSQSLQRRTVLAIALAVLGMVWMQAPLIWPTEAEVGAAAGWAAQSQARDGHLLGILVSLAVPLGGALNWVIIRRGAVAPIRGEGQGVTVDLMPAVFVGAVLSAAVTAAWALPAQATAQDLGWLALLGVFQLALPCLLAVMVAQRLSPTEVSLLSLLEVVFGVAWAWWGTDEAPSASVLAGGALVLGALVVNEAWPKTQV
ncbi:MAG: DMT family transporter [Betaproteobacteria bacterium]|jgi:drug/metabolite transporter (DMT)-like permease